KEGAFREDLYYRLNVIPITVPKLRDRRDDIPLLVAHFLRNKPNLHPERPFQVTHQAMSALCHYDWPGNVRELENAMERACVLCENNLIQINDLPPNLHFCDEQPAQNTPADIGVDSPEKRSAAEKLYPLDSK